MAIYYLYHNSLEFYTCYWLSILKRNNYYFSLKNVEKAVGFILFWNIQLCHLEEDLTMYDEISIENTLTVFIFRIIIYFILNFDVYKCLDKKLPDFSFYSY